MAEDLALCIETVAVWLRSISAETCDHGVVGALLKAAMNLPNIEKGMAVLSRQEELFEAANAGFPRDPTEVAITMPPEAVVKISAEVMARAMGDQRVVCVTDSRSCPAVGGDEQVVANALCVPLAHRNYTVGVLYLEAYCGAGAFSPACVAAASMLATQAAVSIESARLFEALRETHKWMTKGQQVGGMGSYRFNARTRDSRGSKEIYDILGLDKALRPVPFEAYLARIHPDDLPNLETAINASLQARTSFRHEYRVIHGDGAIVEVSAVGEWDETDTGDLELEGIIADVTQAKAAQRRLAEADALLERANGLANLGEIAGSIIHEVNQPLTAIIAGAEASIRWLSRETPNLNEAKSSILRTIDNGRRAAEIVQSLRSLAKRSKLHFDKIAIDEVIEEAMLLARPDVDRSGGVVRMKLNAPSTVILGDKIQLQQVILNLARNAMEAMREMEKGPRVLTVETCVDEGGVTVALHDTGPGLAPDIRDRLFEALYTTKAGGLGLGLAICRKIVAAHEGQLWVADNHPMGASFQFTIPLRRS